MTRYGRTWRLGVGLLAACGTAACGSQGTAGTAGSGQSGSSGGGGGGSGISGGGGSGSAASGSGQIGGSGGAASGVSGGSAGTSAGGSGKSSGPDSGITDAGAPTPHAGNTCLKPGGGDYTKAGPYTVMTKTGVDLAGQLPDAGPTTYTIFYPQPFETSCLHPVVAWGNGTTVTGYQTYQFYNQNAASWGIVVIASDNSNVGSGQYHKVAIDYMSKQNADSTSPFYQKLSTRVGVSGHSQGGIGATAATNLIGASCEAEVCVAGAGSPQKSTKFICLTGSADQAEQGCTSTYTNAGPQAFLADWDGGDHVTTETVAGYIQMQPGSIQMMRLYAAWFRCFLADDQVACKLFQGGAPNNCGICKDPGWHALASRGL